MCCTVNDYEVTSEDIDFHENKYRIVKKSIYQRKYHLENVINDLRSKYNLQISVQNLNKIDNVFKK